MDVLLAFAAALVTLRLAADLVRRWRVRRAPELLAWAASLAAFAAASGALAWGAAAGWDDRAFRAFYLFGGLLTAALLGAGSLLRAGARVAAPVALVYTGLAIGVALAVPIDPPVAGDGIPDASSASRVLPRARSRDRRQRRRNDRSGRRRTHRPPPAARGQRVDHRRRRRRRCRERDRRPRGGRRRRVRGRRRRAPVRRVRQPTVTLPRGAVTRRQRLW